MSEAEQESRQPAAWWVVMQEAVDAMNAYVAVLDRTDIPDGELKQIAVELLAKASRLNGLAEEIATRK